MYRLLVPGCPKRRLGTFSKADPVVDKLGPSLDAFVRTIGALLHYAERQIRINSQTDFAGWPKTLARTQL